MGSRFVHAMAELVLNMKFRGLTTKFKNVWSLTHAQEYIQVITMCSNAQEFPILGIIWCVRISVATLTNTTEKMCVWLHLQSD